MSTETPNGGAKPGLLTYLVIVAGVLLALRLIVPAAFGHPVGRVLILAVSALLTSFALAYAFRTLRR
ncbi:MAG: hypothetical protein ACO1SV_12675 [Fimbriimonas sp.]